MVVPCKHDKKVMIGLIDYGGIPDDPNIVFKCLKCKEYSVIELYENITILDAYKNLKILSSSYSGDIKIW